MLKIRVYFFSSVVTMNEYRLFSLNILNYINNILNSFKNMISEGFKNLCNRFLKGVANNVRRGMLFKIFY